MVAMAASHQAAPGGLRGRMGIWMMEKVVGRALRPAIDPVARPMLSCRRVKEVLACD